MKKIYISPALQVNETEVHNMMAVSLMEGEADPNTDVLSKEDNQEWNLWDE